MAAIVTGNGLGLFNTSLNVLGSAADPTLGRGPGDRIYLNATTGNLIIQQTDEFLANAGLDLNLVRTYNSHGTWDGDNNDNWQLSPYRRLINIPGSPNTANTSVTKVFGDGTEVVYSYDGNQYLSPAGDGAHDRLSYSAGIWTYTDGNRAYTETYNSAGQLLSLKDADGNTTSYTYTGALLTRITDASGQTTYLDYSGNNLTQIRTVSAGQTQIRTRYHYDAGNRLSQVTVDLSPEDASIADGKTYVTTYTYDGTSKRIASITQGDGTTVSFTYDVQGRVKTVIDGVGNVTTYTYEGGAPASQTATANQAALSTTETQTNNVPPYYTVQSGDTWASITQLIYGTSDANAVSALQSALGNPTLSTGLKLTVPSSLSYTSSGGTNTTASANQTVLSTTETQTSYVNYTLNNAALTQPGGTPLSTKYYDDAGSLIGGLTASGQIVSYQYNAQGTLISETIHAQAPLSPLWKQDFSVDAGGFTAPLDSNYYVHENKALSIYPDYTGWSMVFGARTYNFTQYPVFRAEVMTGPTSSGRYFNIGAENVNETRRHAVYFENNQIYAGWYHNGWQKGLLGTAKNNTTYIVEVRLHSGGSTLYVYEKGTSRTSGFVHNRTYTNWSNARFFMETSGDAYLGSTYMRLDNLSEATKLGALIGPYIAVDDAGDQINPPGQGGGAPYYTVQSGDTWSSIATTLYGSANVGDELQTALGNPALTAGTQLTGFPSTLTDTVTTQVTVAPYYTVQSGDTWASITQLIYGTSDANAVSALQSALGNPTLSTGLKLTVPSSLSYTSSGGTNTTASANQTVLSTTETQTNTVPPFYTVQSGDTWTSITQLIYGTSDANAVSALQQALGHPTLSVGLKLTVPSSLSYTPVANPTSAPANQTVLSTTETQSTTHNLNASALTQPAGGLPSGAIAHWAFEEGSGTTVVDGIGARNGSYNNGAAPTGAGYASGTKAANFDGFDDYVKIAHASAFELAQGSIQLRFRADTLGSFVGLFSKDASGYGTGGHIGLFIENGQLRLRVQSTTTSYNLFSGGNLVAGTWYHTAITWGSGGVKLYLNGQLAASDSYTGGLQGNQQPFVIGANAWGSSAQVADVVSDFFHGRIDEVALFNRALTGQEVADLAAGTGAGGPPYYTVQTGDTWSSIATTLYGSANVADELQTALGNPALTAGTQLTGFPSTLTDTQTVTVAPYYTVKSGDTWSSITQLIYGTSDANAVSALQQALGHPTLSTGLKLTVPSSLSYSPDASSGTSGAGTLRVVDALGHARTYAYEANGYLSAFTDALGNTTSYAYDAQGNVTGITDPRGSTTVRQYDGNGNLTLLRDALGNTVTRTYTSANQLLTESSYITPDPDGSGPGQPSNPRTARYAYDGEHHLRFSISAEGRVTEHRYDALGQRVSSILYVGARYDLSGLGATDSLSESELTTWTAAQNLTQTQRTDYSYDFRGQLSTTTTYATVDGFGNGSGTPAVTHYIYDQRGRLTQTLDARGAAPVGVDPNAAYATTYTYDGLGRILTSTQWIGANATRSSTSVYDDAGNRLITTAANGLLSTQTYDARGYLLSSAHSHAGQALGTTSYAYDAAGRLRTVTDPTGVKTHYIYDAAGRRVGEVDGVGALTESVTDPNGQIVKTIRYHDAVSATALTSLNATDAQGNAADVAIGAVRPNTNGSLNPITQYVYDSAGRLVLTLSPHDSDPNQAYVAQRFYDGVGHLTDEIRYATAIDRSGLGDTPTPSAVGARLSANAADRHSRFFHDADGKTIATLDAAGYLRESVYDAAGQLIRTIAYAKASTSATRASDSLAQTKANITGQSPGGINADDQHQYFFYNAQGQLIASLDAENYLTEYQYDLAGNRTQETRYAARAGAYTGTQTLAQLRPAPSSHDRITLTSYNGANQIVSVTSNPFGTVTQYTYDNLGRLSKTDAAFNTTEVRTTQARYDAKGNLVGELTGEGSAALAALSNPTQAQIDGIWSQYGLTHSYDAANRRISTTDANNNKTLFYYDAGNRLTHTVNALGEVSHTVYNALGQAVDTYRYSNRIDTTGLIGGLATDTLTSRISAIANPSGTNPDQHQQATYTLRSAVKAAIDALNKTSTYSYNAFGEVTTTSAPINATQSLVHHYSYDARGQRIRTVWDPSGLNTQATRSYDAFGRLTTVTNENGHTTAYAYDKLGRQLSVTEPLLTTRATTYDAFGRTLTQTDALGRATTFQYDDANRRFTVTTPEGIVTATTSNRHGQTVSITDGNGNTTTYSYDKNGNVKTVTDALSHSTTTSYDKADRKTQVIDANGTITQYTYDAANRLLTKAIDPSGVNLITQYGYDGQGRTLTVTEAPNTTEAHTTQYEYDAKGQLKTTIVDPQSLNPTGLNLTTTYTYDDRGQTLTVTHGAHVPTEARTTAYVYDTLGRRIQEIKDSGTGNLNLTTAYVYDKTSNVVTKIEGQGTPEERRTHYAYDANDRLRYSVDALGGVTETKYDANGQVLQTIHYATAIAVGASAPSMNDVAAALVPDAADRTDRYAYDRDGRLIYRIDTLGAVAENAYDPLGNLLKQTHYATALTATQLASLDTASATNRRNTVQGNLTPHADDRSTRHAYDAGNRLVYTVDALGGVTQQDYDDAGNLTETRHYASALSATQITALDASAPSARLDTVIAAVTPNAASDRITQYDYDRAGRLTQTVDAEGNAEHYGYDSLGNKTSFTNKKGTYAGDPAYTWRYTYDKANRLIEERTPEVPVTRISKDANGNPLLDANGQVISITANEALITRISYDAHGNVKTRTEAYGTLEARTTSYQYDQLGRQIKTIYPTQAFYDATLDAQNNYLGRNESVQTPTSHTTYNALGHALVNKDVSGNYSYKAYDVLGRVVYEIDAERYVTHHTYDSFGNQKTFTRYANPLAESAFTSKETASNAGNVTGFSPSAIAALLSPSPEDRTLTHSYDALGRRTETQQPAVYNYDSSAPQGQQYFTVSPTTKSEYNAFGQVIRQKELKNPGADLSPNTADDQWIETYFYYNPQGQKTAEVNALGYLTTYSYDTAGNLTKQVEYAKALTPNTWTTQSYGTPTATVPTDANSTSAIGFDRETRYTYDRLNQKRTETKVNVIYASATYGGIATPTNVLGNLTTTSGYDVLGNAISVQDPTGATTYTYYDVLGRVIGVAEPARVSETGGVASLPPLFVTPSYLNLATTTSAAWGITGYGEGESTYPIYGWVGSSTATLAWNSLEQWGTGSVRVQIDATMRNNQGNTTSVTTVADNLSAADTMTGVSMTLNAGDGGGSRSGSDQRDYHALQSINRIQVWKKVDGVHVLLFDSTGDVAGQTTLSWAKPSLTGTVVDFTYRKAGTTDTPTLLAIESRGSRYWANLTLPNDQYEYWLTYTRPGESTPYASGSGVFTVTDRSSIGSHNVVGYTEEPYLNLVFATSASWGIQNYVEGAEGGMYPVWGWVGSSAVALTWNSLEHWGTGNVRVQIDATMRNNQGNTTSVTTVADNLNAADVMTGYNMGLNAANGGGNEVSSNDDRDYFALNSINRIQVWKKVDGVDVLLFDTVSDVIQPERLVLKGNTTGLTGVELHDAAGTSLGTRTAVALSAGVYVVDISDLPRGTYSYTPIGTVSNLTGRFDTYGSGAIANPVVQENLAYLKLDTFSASWGILRYEEGSEGGSYPVYGWSGNSSIRLTWNSLEGWGSGDVRVQVDATMRNNQNQTTSATTTTSFSAINAMSGVSMALNAVDYSGGLSTSDSRDYYALQSVNRIQVWKTVDGQEVLLFDTAANLVLPRLEISSLLATAATATLDYRRSGDTGPWLSRPTTKVGTGWFSTAYDDIANGRYDYVLTVKDTAGNPIDLTTQGGTAQGTIAGIMEIKRGGQSLPQVAASSVEPIIPLTLLRYDSVGNTVAQVRYAKGAATVGGDIPLIKGLDSANDQHSFTLYNSHGQLLRTIDAEGASQYFSYDVHGRVRKSWQVLTDADGLTQNQVTRHGYDRLGQKTATIEHLGSGVTTAEEAQYNAFGEISAKGLNGNFPETFEYDAAGRLWRTNAEDGVAKVYFYDLQGRATADIRSPALNLLDNTAYPSAQSVAALTTIIQRTETVYDVLGRVTRQIQPSFSVNQAPDDIRSPFFVTPLYVSANLRSTVGDKGYITHAFEGGDVNQYEQYIDHRIDLGWQSLEGWGNGQVKVKVDYTGNDVFSGGFSGTTGDVILDAAKGMRGATIVWNEFRQAPLAGGGGSTNATTSYRTLTGITRIQVWKQINGEWVAVVDRNALGIYGRQLSWEASSVAGTSVELKYRLEGTQTWMPLSVSQIGDRYVADITSFEANRYEYEVTYTRLGETNPYAQGTGKFVVHGPTASTHVVGVVEAPHLSAYFTSTVGDDGFITYTSGESDNYKREQYIDHRIDLGWQSLEGWGNGQVKVKVDYTGNDVFSGGFSGTTGDVILDAAKGMRGATIAWSEFRQEPNASGYKPSNATTAYRTLTGITRVQVWKEIGSNQWVLVGDSSLPAPPTERLLLGGATAGLTGVEIGNGVGFRAATVIGGGMYAVDVSDLASGRYTYTPIINGVAAPHTGSFETRGVTSTGVPSVQELLGPTSVYLNSTIGDAGYTIYSSGESDTYKREQYIDHRIDLGWQSLEGWGNGQVKVKVDYTGNDVFSGGFSGTTGDVILDAAKGMRGATIAWSEFRQEPNASGYKPSNATTAYRTLTGITRIQVWKQVNGEWMPVIDRSGVGQSNVLSITNLPLAAHTATLDYRFAGGSGPWNRVTTTKSGGNWFTLPYDGIANGRYDYILTARNAAGNPIDLTPQGGTAHGTINGSMEIRRGGQGLADPNAPNIQTITSAISRTVDRWGNALSVTDPRNAADVSYYRYNHLNQAIEQKSPLVSVWGENGLAVSQTPTTRYVYDALGRTLGILDANNIDAAGNAIANPNWTLQKYDEAGQLIAVHQADGGVVEYVYDAFGRRIAMIDASWARNRTDYFYDRNDRLVRQRNAIGETDLFTYDEAGNRITVTNGAGETAKYFYDTRGNLVKTRQPLGQERYTEYDLQGRKIRDTHSGVADESTWGYDHFGKLTAHKDLGGATYTYTYNSLNQLVSQTNTRGQSLFYDYYENGALRRLHDLKLKTETYYEYDAAGQRTRERFSQVDASGSNVVHQDARVSYDVLGRIAQIRDNRYTMTYKYDAVGNRRNTRSEYYDNAGVPQVEDYWYIYDPMNRIQISQGMLNAATNQIELSESRGVQLAYDGAGNRSTAYYYDTNGWVTDSYTYDGANRLLNTHRAGSLTSARLYDAAGRMREYTVYSTPNTITERRTQSYNANGWILRQEHYDASGTHVASVRYDHTDSYDATGNLLKYTMHGLTGTTYNYTYTKTYAKYEGYREANTHGVMAVNYPYGTTTSTGDTTSTYDVNGNLIKVVDRLGTNQTRDFIVNAYGQILQKREGGKTQYYFYANNQPVGSAGDLTAADFDFNYTPVSERYPAATPTSYVVGNGDTLQGIALTVYGDAKLWYLIADANGVIGTDLSAFVGKTLTIPNKITNLHNDYGTFKVYNPGEIVGDLTPTVPIPDPPPPPKAKCNGFAAILVIVVAVVVTIMTTGAMAKSLAPAVQAAGGATGTFSVGASVLAGQAAFITLPQMIAAAAVGAAAGSVASQIVGIGLGVQDKFSWSAVATSALSAGATAGFGSLAQTGGIAGELGIKGKYAQAAINAMASNVVSQGINMLVGQQEKFSWRNVAFSGIGAAFGQTKLASSIKGMLLEPGAAEIAYGKSFSLGGLLKSTGVELIKKYVSHIVSGGGKLDWRSVAADAFGTALGNAFVDHMRYGETTAIRRADAQLALEMHLKDSMSPEDYNRILGAKDLEEQVKAALMVHSQQRKFLVTPDGEVRYFDKGKNGEYITFGDSNVSILDGENGSKKVIYTDPVTGELRELGTDYGPTYKDLNSPGDASRIQRQVVVPLGAKYDELRSFINSGSGQVDPTKWDAFVALAKQLGLPIVTTSNGIDNSYTQAYGNASALSQGLAAGNGEFGVKDAVVLNVYNPNNGFFKDVGEAILGQLGQYQPIMSAIESQMGEAYLHNSSMGMKTLYFGHSQGAITGTNAIASWLSSNDYINRSQVSVVNIGTASWRNLAQDYGINVTNVIDRSDLVGFSGGYLQGTSDRNYENGGKYKFIETDFRRDAYGMYSTQPLLGNYHSFYLYLARLLPGAPTIPPFTDAPGWQQPTFQYR